VGGFQGAIILVFALFGDFFSAKFFVADMAKRMYLVKRKYSS